MRYVEFSREVVARCANQKEISPITGLSVVGAFGELRRLAPTVPTAPEKFRRMYDPLIALVSTGHDTVEDRRYALWATENPWSADRLDCPVVELRLGLARRVGATLVSVGIPDGLFGEKDDRLNPVTYYEDPNQRGDISPMIVGDHATVPLELCERLYRE